MDITQFLKLVGEIRANCGLDCFGPNYYIFIKKGLKTAIVNKTGYVNMSDVAYVLVVCAYRWENLGYVNSSLTTLVMVDSGFQPVDKIPFGSWDMVSLDFTIRPGDWYNKWKPYPILELAGKPEVNTNSCECPYELILNNISVENFSAVLDDINKFVEDYDAGHPTLREQN